MSVGIMSVTYKTLCGGAELAKWLCETFPKVNDEADRIYIGSVDEFDTALKERHPPGITDKTFERENRTQITILRRAIKKADGCEFFIGW